MNVIEVEAPLVEPVTLAEMKHYLRVDSTADDDMISSMIQAAREKVEEITRRSFVQRRLRMVADLVPPRIWSMGRCGCWCFDQRLAHTYLELERSPVREVHSISHEDSEGEVTSLDVADYPLVTDTIPARLYITGTWPSDELVRIEYTAGYASTGSPDDYGVTKVPSKVKSAIKYEVQLQYDELAPDKREKLQESVTRMLESLIVHTF